MKKEIYLLLTAFLYLTALTNAQAPAKKFEPLNGPKGIVRKLADLKTNVAANRSTAKPVEKVNVSPLRFRLDEAKHFKENIRLQKYPDLITDNDEEDPNQFPSLGTQSLHSRAQNRFACNGTCGRDQ